MARTKQTGGCLVKRGGTYYADWMFNGKRHRVSTGETDERKARARLAEIVANFQNEHRAEAVLESVKESLQRATRRNLPIADAFAVYEGDKLRKQISEGTMRVYRLRFGVFAKWAAAEKVETVDDVTPEVARRFMGSIVEGRSAKTFNDYLAALSLAWRSLVAEGYASGIPWTWDKDTRKGIERREKDTHTKKELSREQLDALFLATSGEMRTLFFIGLYTGLRLKDCALLKWEAVDMAGGFIRLTPAKTRRHGVAVSVPILPPLARELQAARAGNPAAGDFVLPEMAGLYQMNGGEVGREGRCLSARITAVFRRAGIAATSEVEGRSRKATDFGFHSLRHTFVSMAARAGIRQAVVQSIVGHTNAAMTLHYTHTNEADAAAAMAAFPIVTPAGGAERPQERTEAARAAIALPAGADAAERPLDALAAILARLDADGLEQAARMVANMAAERSNSRQSGTDTGREEAI